MTGPKKIDVASRLDRNLGLLQAGAPISIDIVTPAGKKGKFRTTFIGYLPKQYVLVQFPEAKKLGSFSHYIVQGAFITVRGLIEGHEGAAVAFVSQILQTLQIPSRLMVLDFPKTVSLQTLRSNVRIDTDVDAKVKFGDEYWQAKILDASAKGCQLNIRNGDTIMMTKDDNVEITIEDFHGASNLKISAVICNIKPQSEAVSIGVKFLDQDAAKITELLHHAILQ